MIHNLVKAQYYILLEKILFSERFWKNFQLKKGQQN
jgi:hypothetical protein